MVTYANADSGAFSLDDAVPAVYKDAQVNGSQMLLRSRMSYQAAAKASTSKNAFEKATSLIVANMLNSMHKRLEIGLLYGQSADGIAKATFTSAAAKATAGNAFSSSALTFTVSVPAAQWASGIWAGAEGMKIDLFRSSNGAKINGNAALSVTTVNLSSRLVSGTLASGDSAAMKNAVISTGQGYVAFFRSAHVSSGTQNEAAGLDKIITNQSSLFNINATTYNLWKGNVVTITQALSLGRVLAGVARAVERGLEEDVICMVSPVTWSNLTTNEAALRRYDGSYKASGLESGAEKLTFFGQNGKIDIVSSIYVKQGECFIFPPKRLVRIGSIDVSFKMPGRTQQEDFFIELTGNAGYELRAYTDQALFCDSPAKLVKINGIVNS